MSELRKSELKNKKNNDNKKAFRNIKYDDDDDVDADDSDFETIDSDDEDEDEDSETLGDSSTSLSKEEEEDEEDDHELNQVIKVFKLHKLVSKLYPSDKKDKKSSKKSDKKKETKKYKKHSNNSLCDDEDEDDEEEDEKKFNVIFNMSALNEDYNSEFESSDEDEDEKKEEEDSDNDEKIFMKENYRQSPPKEKIPPEPTNEVIPKKLSRKQKRENAKKEEDTKKEEVEITIEEEYAQLVEMKREVLERLEKNPTNKYYIKGLKNIKEDIKKLVKKGRKKNTKQFYKLINSDNKKRSELEYFEKKLSHSEQQKIVKELKVINDSMCVDKPYRLSVLESKMPEKVKALALQKLNVLKMMEPGDPEYFKLKNWVDAFMKIPFNKHKNLPVNINDGIEACHDFMENAHNILNECTYGMADAKMQIMQLVGQWITNPDAIGNSVALKGPPGSGKTSIIKDGISKILGRDFVFIPLGGCTDGSYLEGNSYVYEGSCYGKIIQSLIECQSMNPVIYFDELDKVSDSARGQEIIGILTHLTDSSQNSQFHDKYFSEVDFDLSKCLFMFSYNDELLINPILRDRMYKIMTNGYQVKEKVIIGKQYLIPKILQQIKFLPNDIVIPDSVLSYIIENFTQKEEGVRNLKRCLEVVHTKLNLFRLVKPNATTFFSKEINLKINFPHTLTTADVDILVKSEVNKFSAMSMMYL
jgi:ATP-dependent Lon protease